MVRWRCRSAAFATRSPSLPVRPAMLHADNSAAIVRRSPSPWNIVRPGVFLYGVGSGARAAHPARAGGAPARPHRRAARPARRATRVGYDATWRAARPARVATLAARVRRRLSPVARKPGRGRCCAGVASPVVGTVTMDMTMLDVTGVPCAWATSRRCSAPTATSLSPSRLVARERGLSPYELLTGLRQRVARVHDVTRAARGDRRARRRRHRRGAGRGGVRRRREQHARQPRARGRRPRAPEPPAARSRRSRPARTACRRRTHPTGAFGLMEPASAGKDSTTGHWEIAGLQLAMPFPDVSGRLPARRCSTSSRPERAARSSATRRAAAPRCSSGGRRARAHRRMDRVHVGRLGLSGGGARGASCRWPSSTRPARRRARCSCRRTTSRG